MSRESNEWVKGIYKSKGLETGLFVYIDGFTLNNALDKAGIPRGTPVKIKRYALKDQKNIGKIVLKIREDK